MSLKIISPSTVYLGSATGSNGSSSGVSLYDTKLMSQAIADKGWAFQGRATRQDLSKDDIPTVYKDIKMKYDNCDSAPSSSFTTLLDNTVQTGMLAIDDTYIFNN